MIKWLPMVRIIPWAVCAVWFWVMYVALDDAIEALKVTAFPLFLAAQVTYIYRKSPVVQATTDPEGTTANLNRAPR